MIRIPDNACSQEDIIAIIESKPDFQPRPANPSVKDDPPDSRYYTWLRTGQAKAIEERMPATLQHEPDDDIVGLLAEIRLSPGELRLETLGRKKFTFAKKLIKNYFGDKAPFRNQKVVDIGKKLLAKRPESTPEQQKPVAPTIPDDELRRITQDFARKHYTKFLDDSIPMLDGRTPRQAAIEPHMRDKLLDLMKLRVCNFT